MYAWSEFAKFRASGSRRKFECDTRTWHRCVGVCIEGWDGEHRGEGGFIVTTISPWAALARQRCKFRGGRLCSPYFHLWTTNLVIPPRNVASLDSSPFLCLARTPLIINFSPLWKHSLHESHIYLYLISRILFVNSKTRGLRRELIVCSITSRSRTRSKICNFLLFQGTASFKSPRQRSS